MVGFIDEINSYWFSLQFKACGEKFSVRTSSVIYGPENITIGNNFSSMGNLYMYCRNGEILLGDNVAVNTNVQIGASEGRIIIGNNVIIGPNVVIRCANHIITATGSSVWDNNYRRRCLDRGKLGYNCQFDPR